MSLIRISLIVFMCVVFLGGCTNENGGNTFAGIQWSDFSSASEEKLVLVEEFKGSGEFWSAEYFEYTIEDDKSIHNRLLLKYNGKKPYPTGEISIDYDAGDAGVASNSSTFNEAPDDGIYPMLGSGKDMDVSSKTIIKLSIKSNSKSEIIELKPS